MRLSLPILPPSDRPRRWIVPAMLIAMASTVAIGLAASQLQPTIVGIGIALAIGTFVSEDLALIAAAEAIRRGSLDLAPAFLGSFMGIWVGDLGLWAIGRFGGRRVLSWNWVSRRISQRKLDKFAEWLKRRSAVAIFVARFVPGLRFPTYVAAGVTGRGGWQFAGWSFLAAAVWTPLLIGLVVVVGDLIATPLRTALGYAWLTVPAAVVLLYVVFRVIGRLADPIHRFRATARLQRLWRWEFWPAWLFYVPVAVYIVAKSLRRGGLAGFARITAANPGIADGGFVGESKQQILSSLPPEHVIPYIYSPQDASFSESDRAADLQVRMESRGWRFPLIVKPDIGQRGVGVRKCHSASELRVAVQNLPVGLIAQPYHPGPHEVGVFYVRLPSESKGRIFSITEKVFPNVVGDGTSTLAELIWRHPRYRMQADMFLARFAEDADRVVPAGELQTLSAAGNHCQGTLFREGGHLRTASLEAKIDQIARGFPGFYFGRFDIRYSDPAAFGRGDDLAIVELNGITSESTNVYDPAGTLIGAWLTFVRQWRWLFAIADENIALGHRPTPWRSLWRSARNHVLSPT